MFALEKKLVSWHILVAIVALALGILFGPLQSFEHMGINLYPFLQPLLQSYYQGLTLHGVLNALVWTTFFITGFMTLTTLLLFFAGVQLMFFGVLGEYVGRIYQEVKGRPSWIVAERIGFDKPDEPTTSSEATKPD